MSVLRKVSAGVPQHAASLWRTGVKPDRGFYGYDPRDNETWPKWYVPSHGEMWNEPKDTASLRDRLCGVRQRPGEAPAGAGKGRLLGWLLINRKGRAVTRNPYSGALDDLGRLTGFRQCSDADGAAYKRGTLFRFEATSDEGSHTTSAYVSIQALLPWTWQDHWHRELMRSTWRRNTIDVWSALQAICGENVDELGMDEYEQPELDMSRLPVIRYTHGHPSPPRWKLPIFPESRRPIDKVMTGWDASEWNFHPAPFGEHKNNPATHPEFRKRDSKGLLDTHLNNIGKHPHDLLGTRSGNMGYGPLPQNRYRQWFYTQEDAYLSVLPQWRNDQFEIWAKYENRFDIHKLNSSKASMRGPAFQNPIRMRATTDHPVALST